MIREDLAFIRKWEGEILFDLVMIEVIREDLAMVRKWLGKDLHWLGIH